MMETTDAIKNISSAIKDHTVWMENINKTLICDIKPADNMLDKEAHLKCNFGKWLEANKEQLQEINKSIFDEVYKEHQNLHSTAKEILDIAYEHNFLNLSKHKTIPESKYNALLNLSKEIKSTLRQFRSNIYGS